MSRALADNRPALPLSFAALALIGVRQCYAQAPSFFSATGLLTHVPTRCPAPSSRGSPARTAVGSHYPPPTAASMRAGGSPPLAPKVRGILPLRAMCKSMTCTTPNGRIYIAVSRGSPSIAFIYWVRNDPPPNPSVGRTTAALFRGGAHCRPPHP